MYTTMAFIALTASVTSGNLTPAPTVQTDYRAAQTTVATAHKPMAVFIADGSAGWDSVVIGGIDAGTKKVLAEKFVCLFVDASTPQGRATAEAFQVGRGLVISDRTGTVQAYSMAGDLSRAELTTALEKYSDAAGVETTETVLRGSEISYGGGCSNGTCSTGTCFTGHSYAGSNCSTGTCGSPVSYHAAPASCGTPVSTCNAPTSSCGSSRKCGFGGFGCFRSKCGGSMPSCGTSHAAPAMSCGTSSCGGRSSCFGGGMKSCGTWGGGCSTGGCK